MYNELKTNRQRYKFESFEHMDDRLRNLSSMYFINLRVVDEEKLLNSKDNVEFLANLLILNNKYPSIRFSKRYQKEVKSGGSEYKTGTSRSVTDLFMLAIHYRPEIKLTDVYLALAELLRYNALGTRICNVINRRVYPFSIYAYETNILKKYSIAEMGIKYNTKLEIDELGVSLAIDYIENKYIYEFNSVKLHQTV